MNIYFIDYENVKSDGLNGITKLNKDDKVIIFYSENADKLTFGLHRRINEAVADISYIKVEVGTKNALDFQLVSYLGYLIAQKSDDTFHIISNDAGFNSVVKFWQKKRVIIDVATDLSGQSNLQKQKSLMGQIFEVLSDKEEAKEVFQYIEKYKTKQGLNNALVKRYDSKNAGRIYQAIKPLIKDKKGN